MSRGRAWAQPRRDMRRTDPLAGVGSAKCGQDPDDAATQTTAGTHPATKNPAMLGPSHADESVWSQPIYDVSDVPTHVSGMS